MSLMMVLCCASAVCQNVPVRLSFNFILNASGNRPATGNINTDAEVEAQIQRANQILSGVMSELRLESVAIRNVNNPMWYGGTTDNRDAIRRAAIDNQDAYHWRNDAVNIYITGASDSAIADFPPNNNIIILCQGIFETTLVHEVGHILNLIHTHDSDGCGDTLMDNQNWSQDDIAVNNFFGLHYNQLNPTQQSQVDRVWWNVMSYHNLNDRSRLTGCQMDRQSGQAYAERGWMLSRIPVYVDPGYGGPHAGSFTLPFQYIQQAVDAGVLSGSVLVLEPGTHPRPAVPLTTPTSVVTRRGGATIQEMPPLYSLPYTLEQSTNEAVRTAVTHAQQSDKLGDIDGVIASLQEAEKHATGREKSSLQLELAQRFRDSDQYELATAYFKKTAAGADQAELRKHALKNADAAQKAAGQQRQKAQEAKSREKTK